jgi:hypothetical protein
LGAPVVVEDHPVADLLTGLPPNRSFLAARSIVQTAGFHLVVCLEPAGDGAVIQRTKVYGA